MSPQMSLYHSLVSLHTQELRISFVLLTIIIYYHRILRNTELALRALTQVLDLDFARHVHWIEGDDTEEENYIDVLPDSSIIVKTRRSYDSGEALREDYRLPNWYPFLHYGFVIPSVRNFMFQLLHT